MSLHPERSASTEARDISWGTAMEYGGIGLYSWTPATAELTWDDQVIRMFDADLSRETPLEVWRRRVLPDDQVLAIESFAEFPDGTLPECVYRIVLDDATVRYLMSRTTDVVRDHHGGVLRTRGAGRDQRRILPARS
jgi:hypothetical protein